MTSLLVLILASAPTVVLMDGAHCGRLKDNELQVRVRERGRDVDFRAESYPATIDPKAGWFPSDVVRQAVSGRGPSVLVLEKLSPTELKLVAAGWRVLRAVDVLVGAKRVASVGPEVSRTGGQCLVVEL